MNAATLKSARLALGMNQAAMAKLLDTPYRTYQDWEADKARIPGVVGVAVRLLQERERWVMRSIIDKIDADLASRFPAGIPSEREVEDER